MFVEFMILTTIHSHKEKYGSVFQCCERRNNILFFGFIRFGIQSTSKSLGQSFSEALLKELTVNCNDNNNNINSKHLMNT